MNGAARLLATRTLNEAHPMDGAEHSPKAEEIAKQCLKAEENASALPPTDNDHAATSASPAAEELTLDVLASRIDGMGKWAQATQQQIRNLQLLASTQEQLQGQLRAIHESQELLAGRVADIDAAASDLLVDPVIGYQPKPEQQAQLFSALAEWQATARSLEKGRVAEMATRSGGTATYRYVDIADVSEVARSAGAAGLAHFHRELYLNGRSFIRTYLVHQGGGWICCDVPLTIRETGLTSAIQQWGAASTYARRYGLFLILGIAAGDEDDDGASFRSASRSSGSPRAAGGSPTRAVRTAPAPPARQTGQ